MGWLEILLVEDNPADIELTKISLDRMDITKDGRLHVVTDGLEALDFLQQRGTYSAAPRPDFILLDLNLPKKNGHEVLATIKSDDSLKLIPVVVLSSSLRQEDVLESYELHANCYLRKPTGLQEFESIAAALRDFWFTVAKLPPRAY